MKKIWIFVLALMLISFGCEQPNKKDDSKESAEKPLKNNNELKGEFPQCY